MFVFWLVGFFLLLLVYWFIVCWFIGLFGWLVVFVVVVVELV